jgi:hypothetical protein
MCETSFYQLFLQGVGIVTIAILVGGAFFILTNPDPIDRLFDDEQKGGKK